MYVRAKLGFNVYQNYAWIEKGSLGKGQLVAIYGNLWRVLDIDHSSKALEAIDPNETVLS